VETYEPVAILLVGVAEIFTWLEDSPTEMLGSDVVFSGVAEES
jgi:hypothetical protein